MDDFEPQEPRVSDFDLEERQEARILDSVIVNQVDQVMRVLSQQIIAVHNESLYCATSQERMRSARLIHDLSTVFQQFLLL